MRMLRNVKWLVLAGLLVLCLTISGGNKVCAAEASDACYFDSSNKTLYLKGEMSDTNSIATALNGTAKTEVKKVVCCEGVKLPSYCGALFQGLTEVESIDLTGVDSSGVTDMRTMFAGCTSLRSIDLTPLDTSSVGGEFGFIRMFTDCSSLESITLGGKFKTSAAQKLTSFFSGCSSLKSIDISKLNTSGAWDISHMFNGCSSLTSLDTANMSISSVYGRGFVGLFTGCSSLKELDLSKWSTSGISIMANLFSGCSSLTTIYVGEGWRVGQVSESPNMFSGCTSLVGGAGTRFDPNGKLDKTFACFDQGELSPGYLTRKGDPPVKTELTTVAVRCDATNKLDDGSYLRTYSYTGEPIVPKEIWVYEYYSGTRSYKFMEASDYYKKVTDNIEPGKGKITVYPTEYGRYTFEPVTHEFPIEKAKVYDKDSTQQTMVGREGSSDISTLLEEADSQMTLEVNDPDNIFDGTPTLSIKELRWKIREDESLVGKKAWLNVSVAESVHYKAYKIHLIVTVKKKETVYPESVRISQSTLKLKVGDTFLLSANVLPEDVEEAYREIRWSSGNDNIVKVDQNGLVTAVSVGKMNVYAAVKEYTSVWAGCSVTVTKEGEDPDPEPDPPVVPIPGGGGPTDPQPLIDENTTSLLLVKGQKFVLAEKDWTSSAKKVVSVSKGSVTAKGIGTAVLTRGREGIVRTLNVTVVNPAITSKDRTVKLVVGDSDMPLKMVEAMEEVNKTIPAGSRLKVLYNSASPDIATVNENGEVNAVSKGNAVINAYVNGVLFKFTVKVSDVVNMKPDFALDNLDLYLQPMQTIQVKAKGFKAGQAEWSSRTSGSLSGNELTNGVVLDDGVVRITKAGKLTAVGPGTTRVRTTGGGVDFSFTVTVDEPTIKTVHINVNGSRTLKIYGTKGLLDWKTVNESGKEITSSVVSINKNKVTGSSTGEVMLKTRYEGFDYYVRTSVEDPAVTTGGFTGKPYVFTVDLNAGETAEIAQLKVYQDVLFKSDKSHIAFVNENGKIQARSCGNAKLTAKVNGKTISIKVRVKQARHESNE